MANNEDIALDEQERQRGITEETLWKARMPCANCTIPVSPAMAKISEHNDDYSYRCPACGALLTYTMPIVAIDPHGWHWQITPGQINPWSAGVGALIEGRDVCACQHLPNYVREHLEKLRSAGLDAISATDADFLRLVGCAAAALERADVGDAEEATAILKQVVTLDGHYIKRES